jgi:hypothetical protein
MHMLRRRRSAARRFLLGAAGAVLASGLTLRAETDPALELRVKAAFLYNFARFVDWPASAFASADAPFVIGVFGDESIAQALEQIVKGKSIGNRVIQTRRIPDATRIHPCQILFVSQSETQQVALVVTAVGSAPVLLVGESPGFVAAGGTIGFTKEEGRVRFEASTAAAARANLKISSKLLRLATSVVPSARRDGK